MPRACLAWLAFVMPIALLASEGRVTGTDVAEIRAVIHRQIDAFRRDDAHGAFALVSPGGEVVQQVQLTDRAGGLWLAYYAMQRQKDGTWRTNGCHLVQPSRIISA